MSRRLVRSRRPPSEAEVTALEVDALYRLHQVEACLGQESTVSRADDGTVVIRALVGSDSRRDELVEALRPLAGSRVVTLEIKKPESHPTSETLLPGGLLLVRDARPVSDESPAYDDLRRYFLAQRPRAPADPDPHAATELVDEAVRQLSSRLILHSRLAALHAGALKQLVAAHAPAGLEPLSAARKTWRMMVRDHARALQQETMLVRLDLQPIFFSPPPGEFLIAEDDSDIELAREELAHEIDELFDLAAANDQAVRGALTLTAGSAAPELAIKYPEFWRALRRVEGRAARLQVRFQPPPQP